MRLDAADLAILELDIEKLGPLGRDVARMLIEQLREREAEAEEDENARLLVKAVDCAKDALIALEGLRPFLVDAPYEADQKADAIERELESIVDP